MTAPSHRMTGISGEEALYLLDGASQGQLVYVQRQVTAVRPASHVLEHGRLTVRAPAPTTALYGRPTVTLHVEQSVPATGTGTAGTGTGTGWTVTTSGVAEVLTHPDEAAHYRRTLHGWAHGPHDSLIRLHPHTVHGYRFEAASPAPAASDAGRRTLQ